MVTSVELTFCRCIEMVDEDRRHLVGVCFAATASVLMWVNASTFSIDVLNLSFHISFSLPDARLALDPDARIVMQRQRRWIAPSRNAAKSAVG